MVPCLRTRRRLSPKPAGAPCRTRTGTRPARTDRPASVRFAPPSRFLPRALTSDFPGRSLDLAEHGACTGFSNGCALGCKYCDGFSRGPIPWGSFQKDPFWNRKFNLCPVGAANSTQVAGKPTATICDPHLRTINTHRAGDPNGPNRCGGPKDWYYYSPWRAPGAAREYRSPGSATQNGDRIKSGFTASLQFVATELPLPDLLQRSWTAVAWPPGTCRPPLS